MVSSHFHLWVGLEKLVYSCHVHFHTSSSFFSLLKPLLPLHSTLTETTLVSLIEGPLSCHIQCMLFTLSIFFLHFFAFDSVGFSILRTPSYLSSSNILFFKYHSPESPSLCYFLFGLLFCSAFNRLYSAELCSWLCFLICLFILPTPCP